MNWAEWLFESVKDKRFWVVLILMMIFVFLLRLKSSPIPLPEAAHNTVGDTPLLEQADDGYVSSIGEKKNVKQIPFVTESFGSTAIIKFQGYGGRSIASFDIMSYQ